MPLSDRQLHYYDALRKMWPDLGAASANDADVASMKAARAIPRPVEPDVPHWHNAKTPEEKAEAAQHHQYFRDAAAWHSSWATFWESSDVLEKIEALNAKPMVDASKPTGRMIVAGVDAHGRQILEPETHIVKVEGKAWWEENGYSGPISPADLHIIFERHGEVLS